MPYNLLILLLLYLAFYEFYHPTCPYPSVRLHILTNWE